MIAESPIRFYVAPQWWSDQLTSIDPDRDPRFFSDEPHISTTQTFLRLRHQGHAVELTNEAPCEGVVVADTADIPTLLRWSKVSSRMILVAIRRDSVARRAVDFEVLLNDRYVDDRRFHVPLWGQPGLLSRDSTRGSRIERIGFLGFSQNLHPGFQSREWTESLRARGISWSDNSVLWRTGGLDSIPDWTDLREFDLIVAIRPDVADLHLNKPALKLRNAWRAGIPAVIGPEYASRCLRTSDLDYIEARSPSEALAAIDRLRAEPHLYQAMVANGLRRAEEFSVEAIAKRWEQVLCHLIPARLPYRLDRLSRRAMGLQNPTRRRASEVARALGWSG